MAGLKNGSLAKASKSDAAGDEKEASQENKRLEEDIENCNEDDYKSVEIEEGVSMEFVDERINSTLLLTGARTMKISR